MRPGREREGAVVVEGIVWFAGDDGLHGALRYGRCPNSSHLTSLVGGGLSMHSERCGTPETRRRCSTPPSAPGTSRHPPRPPADPDRRPRRRTPRPAGRCRSRRGRRPRRDDVGHLGPPQGGGAHARRDHRLVLGDDQPARCRPRSAHLARLPSVGAHRRTLRRDARADLRHPLSW